MSTTGALREDRPEEPPASGDDRRRSADAVHQVCPFLVAADGDWRSAAPTRDHRCGATLPPAAPAIGKQRDTCLVRAHVACATFVAARDLELASAGGGRSGEDGFWPETRGIILALESPKGRIGGVPGSRGRAGGQAMLVGLMVLAFLVLVIARTSPPSATGGPGAPATGGPSASGSTAVVSPAAPAGPGASASTAVSPALPGPSISSASPDPGGPSGEPSAPPSPATTPRPTPDASPAATQTPIPAGARTYRVRSGDTLSTIAARYQTTVKQLKAANGITDASLIRVGQVLVIP